MFEGSVKKNKFNLKIIAKRIFDLGPEAIKETILNEKHYLFAYPTFLQLGKDATSENLLGLELAVYGWLPTIMKTRPSDVFNDTTVTLANARRASSLSDGLAVLDSLKIKGDSKHSWIAVSKVLHAINPRVFPILDRRVGKAFDVSSHSLRNLGALKSYTKAMHSVPPCILPIISQAKKIVQEEFKYEMTDIRALELILFALPPPIKDGSKLNPGALNQLVT